VRTALRVAFLCLLAVLCTPLQAQVTFLRTYGGPYSEDGYCVRQTADGGYVIVGSDYAGMINVWLIRTDSRGETLWTRSYGGTWEVDIGYSVQQTVDGGYVIADETYCFGAGRVDAYLVRTDAVGETLWTRTYGGERNDFGFSVWQTEDHGFAVAGATGSSGAGMSDAWLIRTDSVGETLWTRTYGDTLENGARSLAPTFDGGFVLCGTTTPPGSRRSDVLLIRTDSSGDTLWTRSFGGPESEWGYSVQQTADSGFIAAGLTESYGAGDCDIWLLRTDAAGDTLWTRTYGGNSSEYSYPIATQQTRDRGYVIVGATGSYGAGGFDAWLIKTDSSGDTAWTRTFGGDSWDAGCSVQQTSDGGYAITGHTKSFGAGRYDVWLIKTDPEGNVAVTDRESPVARDANSATLVRGVLHLLPSPFPRPKGEGQGMREQAELLDAAGRKVMSLQPGPNNVRHLAPGVYFVHQASGAERDGPDTAKVIVTR